MTDETVPHTTMARVAVAQARLETVIAPLDDNAVRAPSRLPGWTVGHVLTHLARNADSHRRRSEAAARGHIVEQYPGGADGRAAEIETGAGRPAPALRADVAESAAALAATWGTVPDDAWDRPTVDVAGRRRPLRDLVDRRWQEVEVHVVDLGVGASQRDWSDEFVADRLPRLRATMDARLPTGATPPGPGQLDERDELAWLYGRLERPGLPRLADWD